MSQNLQLRKSGSGYSGTSTSLTFNNNNNNNSSSSNNSNNVGYFTDVFPVDGSSHCLLIVPYRYIAFGTAVLPFFALVSDSSDWHYNALILTTIKIQASWGKSKFKPESWSIFGEHVTVRTVAK